MPIQTEPEVPPCTDEGCPIDVPNHTMALHSSIRPRIEGAIRSYDAALEEAAQDLIRLCLRRHRAYGQNLLRHGEEGIIIRVDDKTERIENMLSKGVRDLQEPIEDSWLDIAGYALQAVLMRRGQFTLPMRDG